MGLGVAAREVPHVVADFQRYHEADAAQVAFQLGAVVQQRFAGVEGGRGGEAEGRCHLCFEFVQPFGAEHVPLATGGAEGGVMGHDVRRRGRDLVGVDHDEEGPCGLEKVNAAITQGSIESVGIFGGRRKGPQRWCDGVNGGGGPFYTAPGIREGVQGHS